MVSPDFIIAVTPHQSSALLGAASFLVIGAFLLWIPTRWLDAHTRFRLNREPTTFERRVGTVGARSFGVLFLLCAALLGLAALFGRPDGEASRVPQVSDSIGDHLGDGGAATQATEACRLHLWAAILAAIVVLTAIATPFLLRRGVIRLSTPRRRKVFEFLYCPGMAVAFAICLWLSVRDQPNVPSASEFLILVIALVVMYAVMILLKLAGERWSGKR
jgi:ABC-type Fe3+ transport system permease subunit